MASRAALSLVDRDGFLSSLINRHDCLSSAACLPGANSASSESLSESIQTFTAFVFLQRFLNMSSIRIWLRQPTTVAGISASIGTAVALLLGQVTFVQAVPLFVGAAISAILPDNTGAKEEAQVIATRLCTHCIGYGASDSKLLGGLGSIRIWLRQPTTVAGISASIGTAVALLLGQVTFVQAVPLFVGAAISAILPDNTGAKEEAQVIATSLIKRFGAKRDTT